MGIARSEKARRAKSVFYRAFNDVDIYVEDTARGSLKLYTCIFQRVVIGPSKRIDTVFALGGRDAVLRACSEDQEEGGRRRIYVIDGDLTLFADAPGRSLKRLLTLRRYCIENYLIDEDAIIDLLDEEDIESTKIELRMQFAFRTWVTQTERPLFALFLLYSVHHHAMCSEPTVSYPVNKLVSSSDGTIDINKVCSRMKEIKEGIVAALSAHEYKKRMTASLTHCKQVSSSKLSFISGRDYLLPLVIMRMRSITRLRADNAVIKQRLAMKCDLSELMEDVTLIFCSV
ncbi:DUF4435 domain-containing protein [Defluviicoccus vanus]|uniref:DUF4435 domain-containing protein n=1 Tax=Defluviicoccus vanus TaxID=111831 RepID=A0A7H1N3I2_9PROT|nr:DUF4435 domain-containing protein [Defluviicoccus vanus]QNT70268.1 DUF4435 domain-containing protein [Defluviicoccus vanus]